MMQSSSDESSLSTLSFSEKSVSNAFSPETITITVKLFAAFQDAYGVPELILDFPVGARVVEVFDRLLHDHPQLEKWREVTRFGIDLQFVDPDTPLQAGHEVVLIPPVSGG